MCRDQVPDLSIRAAADRLAERLDVPELRGDFLGRERDREASHYLKTTPGPWYAGEPAPAGWGDRPLSAVEAHGLNRLGLGAPW